MQKVLQKQIKVWKREGRGFKYHVICGNVQE